MTDSTCGSTCLNATATRQLDLVPELRIDADTGEFSAQLAGMYHHDAHSSSVDRLRHRSISRDRLAAAGPGRMFQAARACPFRTAGVSEYLPSRHSIGTLEPGDATVAVDSPGPDG